MYKNLIIFSLFCSNILYAQSSPDQCADIESNADRLACYDSFFVSETESLINTKESAETNDPVNKKDEEILSFDEKNKLKSFKQLRMANLIPEKEETKIFTTITKATKQLTKKIVFRLENGHVWESESSVPNSKAGQFKKGTKVELEVSRMGGFWMINRSNNIRIKVIRVK